MAHQELEQLYSPGLPFGLYLMPSVRRNALMFSKRDTFLSDKPPFQVHDVIDFEKLNVLFQSYAVDTNTPVAVLDLDGNILIAAQWQDACTQFHRANSITVKRCIESDTALASSIEAGQKYNLYRCKNGLVDVATPIVIGGYHVLNLFTGQFFLEYPDQEFFHAQAIEAGFEPESYLKAINRVPIYSEAEIKTKIDFLVQLAQMIGEAGMLNLQLRQANRELVEHKDHLAELVDEKTQELRIANDSLEERIEERTRELAEAKEQSEIANRAKTVFLSRMSHELRTPLNATLGFAQLLQFSFEEQGAAEKEITATKHIINAGQHLLMLIDDIMDVINFDGRERDIELEDLRLDTVIQDSISMVSHRARELGISISAGSSLICVHANARRLKQVLVNLLTNAIKYNHRNGAVMVQVLAPGNGEVGIVVEDTGVGLQINNEEDIFAPFVRLPYAENHAIEGTGIGLALSKYLIEKMGGAIGFDAETRNGSRFWISIPEGDASRITTGNPQTSKLRANPDDLDCSILYIEDNRASRALMCRAAEFYPKISLTTVDTAEEGVVLADTLKPVVILLDINLPGMSGLEAIRMLKANPKLKDTYFVALSADAQAHQIDAALQAGFDRYLTKPVELPQIVELFEEFGKSSAPLLGQTIQANQ